MVMINEVALILAALATAYLTFMFAAHAIVLLRQKRWASAIWPIIFGIFTALVSLTLTAAIFYETPRSAEYGSTTNKNVSH